MHFSGTGVSESSPAYMTRERLLAVYPKVFLDGGFTGQLHPAYVTLVLPFVHLLYMAVKALLSLQPLPAHRALEFGVPDSVIVMFVEVEGDLVWHFDSAHVADAWLPIVRH